ncbi:MAG: hypothetical protein SH859_14925 [Hyphomicrobium aestuarii]|nr:hypothetical protein [Hyphomicrobium aestuarii]
MRPDDIVVRVKLLQHIAAKSPEASSVDGGEFDYVYRVSVQDVIRAPRQQHVVKDRELLVFSPETGCGSMMPGYRSALEIGLVLRPMPDTATGENSVFAMYRLFGFAGWLDVKPR